MQYVGLQVRLASNTNHRSYRDQFPTRNVARIENENQLADAHRYAHLSNTCHTLSPGGRPGRFNFLGRVIGRELSAWLSY